MDALKQTFLKELYNAFRECVLLGTNN